MIEQLVLDAGKSFRIRGRDEFGVAPICHDLGHSGPAVVPSSSANQESASWWEITSLPLLKVMRTTVVIMGLDILNNTRQMGKGNKSHEGVENKKGNLPLSERFHGAAPHEHHWDSSPLTNNWEYRYNPLIGDLLFLGKGLPYEHKLRWHTYSVFTSGLLPALVTNTFRSF